MEQNLDLVASGDRKWIPVLHDFYEPYSATLERARETVPKIELVSVPTGEDCPECGRPLLYKHGRFGKFIGCSGFPDCRFRAPIVVKTGVQCPDCGGELVEKRTRRGRTFYGCSSFRADDPDSCKFAVWKRPLPQPCPVCGGLLTEGRSGTAKCQACGESVETDTLASAPPAPAAETR